MDDLQPAYKMRVEAKGIQGYVLVRIDTSKNETVPVSVF